MAPVSFAQTLPGCLALVLVWCASLPALAQPPTRVPPTQVAPPQVSVNSLGMPFVRIPAGHFLRGSAESADRLAQAYPQLERRRLEDLADEAPMRSVRITRPFDLGQTEVTVGQFRRFVLASGYRTESEADGTGGYGYNPAYDPAQSARGDAFDGRDPRYSWRNPGFSQGEDHPVVNLTWHDAHALAAWLSATEGRRYRLPTEAEWEYACRAGTTTRYSHGDDPAQLTQHANVFDQDAAPHWPRWQAQAAPGHDGHAFTAPVGRYAPNAFGLHDMVGNVWEWVSDWYGEDSYAQAPQDNPQGPAIGQVRVRRGGSWHTWPFYARCAFRNWNTPQTRYTLVGLRLVRDVEATGGRRPAAPRPRSGSR